MKKSKPVEVNLKLYNSAIEIKDITIKNSVIVSTNASIVVLIWVLSVKIF